MNNQNPVDPNNILWCPFCNWHQRDAYVARKRLGSHIVGDHPEEVTFKKGVKPPEIIDYREVENA